MKQEEKERQPNVKRYRTPVESKPETAGIDLERAYRTLMEGFIDAFMRQRIKATPVSRCKQLLEIPWTPLSKQAKSEKESSR